MNVQDNKLENVKVVYVASSRGDAALNVLWLLVAIAAGQPEVWKCASTTRPPLIRSVSRIVSPQTGLVW